MKKHLFGILGIISAISFSGFANSEKKTEAQVTMKFTGDVTNPCEVADPLNWVQGSQTSVCQSSNSERACTIIVDKRYTHSHLGKEVFNTYDPDGLGPEMKFPDITVIDGALVYGIQYKIVDDAPIEIPGYIDVVNASL